MYNIVPHNNPPWNVSCLIENTADFHKLQFHFIIIAQYFIKTIMLTRKLLLIWIIGRFLIGM